MYTFTNPALVDVQTTSILDQRGVLVHVGGQVTQACKHGVQHKLVVDTGVLIRGHSKEDPARLTQVEWMVRGEMPKCKQQAQEAAEQITLDLIQKYIEFTWKDPCDIVKGIKP